MRFDFRSVSQLWVTSVVALAVLGCSPGNESSLPTPLPTNTATLEKASVVSPFTIGYGEKYPAPPINESNFPLPLALEGFTAPMPKEAALPMFFDYEIVLLAQTGLVYSIRTSRAYADLDSCNTDMNLAVDTVRSRIPGLKGESPQFESDSFIVDLYCGYSEGGRFVELEFAIFHKPTKEKIVVPDYSEY